MMNLSMKTIKRKTKLKKIKVFNLKANRNSFQVNISKLRKNKNLLKNKRKKKMKTTNTMKIVPMI